MSSLSLLIVLAVAAPAWKADVLSDQAQVRAPALAHLHARGRSGLYALQGLVESAATVGERARAVRALGELGNPEAEWELRSLLKQSSPVVVTATVRAAVQLKLPGLTGAIVAKVGAPDRELCLALGEAAAFFPAVAEAARKGLEESGPHQLAGLRILQAARLSVGEPLARRLTASSIPEVRLVAAESLVATDPDAAVATLESLLTGALGTQAATAVGHLGTPRALALLEQRIKQTRGDPGVLLAVAGSAAGERLLLERRAGLPPGSRLVAAIDSAIDAEARTPELLVQLLADPEERVAQAAAEMLGRRPSGWAVLEACLERLQPQAPHCAAGLATGAGAQAETAIARALASLEPGVRSAMVTGLGEAEPKSHLDALAALTNDPSSDVRVALAASAGHFGEPGAAILNALVHDNQAAVRTAAAAQLVSVLPSDRLAALAVEAIADPVIRAPLLEAEAIEKLPAREGIRLLRACLRDPNGSERRQAMLALAHFHDPEAVNALMDSAASDADPALRELAYTTLASQ